MSPIEEYLAQLPAAEKAEFSRIRQLVRAEIPEVEEGRSYAMPAYLYKGKGLLSAMVNKNFLSIYPFSGKVITALERDVQEFECTSGSIHFTLEKPLSDMLLQKIIRARKLEIDSRHTEFPSPR